MGTLFRIVTVHLQIGHFDTHNSSRLPDELSHGS